MPFKPMDDRQVVNRAVLQALFPWVGEKTLDVLMSSINAEVTPPLMVTATSSPSLTVDVGPAIVSNPESNRKHSISFIDNVIPTFNGGTVTFPSTNGGNITTSTGGSVPLTLPIGNYVQILLSLDQSGNLLTASGTPNPVLSSAMVPTPSLNTLPFAYVTLFNNAGTISNVVQGVIYQFSGGGGGGGSGGGIAQEEAIPMGVSSHTVTFPSPLGGNAYTVIGQIVNTTDALPEFIPFDVTAKTNTGFTITWNTPTPTANYKVDYIVPGVQEQIGEAAITNGTTSLVITLPIPLATSSYVVVANLENFTDISPQFQPLTITNKTNTSFTVKWNAPVGSSNFLIAYHAAAYQ